ncbi:hypothetical protein PILCRDRAFT_802518 [Piloderma croceum F 1598]|uniref:Cytochrome P450 n=1 Tax=Piloderma croceum (strain F 1598) TaxID=765440 RepID=A0A0C3ELN3_PILCF|nr:hypothetical protein PILCRDRAFT_802518 [Piloderma croceum F 1598]
MLLDKRGNKYSSRPERTMVYEMGWDWALTMMPYGPRWRRHRTKFQKHFHASLSPLYQPTQMAEAHTLLRNLLTNPDDFNHYIRRAAAAIILNITYGYSVADEHDAYVVLANTTMRSFAQAIVFGSYLVDYIPMLKYVPSWMPGASFKRKAREWRRLSREMLENQFKLVKQRMAHGTAVSCITTRELDNWMEAGGSADEEELIMNIAAIAYAGGADTTVSSITSFFLAMVLSPDIQKKAQDEIDRLTTGNRIPTFADKLSLPYISCIIWECLRWNPASPLGGTHFTTEDDEYNGYRIPKGTTVIPNVWAVLHDEHTYPEPFKFNPDRFENQEMNRLAGINELPQAAFGFGRRMCPGRWLAYDSIWITVVSVLSVYNISTAIDNNGLPILPSVEYTSSSFSHPKPFKCRIVSRSEAAAALIKQTAEERA